MKSLLIYVVFTSAFPVKAMEISPLELEENHSYKMERMLSKSSKKQHEKGEAPKLSQKSQIKKEERGI